MPGGKIRWTAGIIWAALRYRRGRTAVLFLQLLLAAMMTGALLELSVSLDRLLAGQLERYGAGIIITPATDAGRKAPLLDEALTGRLREAFRGTSPTIWQRLLVDLEVNGQQVLAEGFEPAELSRYAGWWRLDGHWPTANELLVGSTLAERLRIKAGDTVTVTGRGTVSTLQVAGIVSSGEEDDRLIIPLTLSRKISGLPGQATQFRLLLQPKQSLAAEVLRLQGIFPGLTVREVRQVARANQQLRDKVLLLFSLAAAVVGVSAAIGVAGTLGATILEREQEIGLLKAIGATWQRVAVLIASEAMLLALGAGLAGGLLGEGLTALVTMRIFAGPYQPTLLALPTGLLAAVTVAFTGIFWPLVRIHRLAVATSLRQ